VSALVEALNLTKRLAILTDGRTMPITSFIDVEGDETNDLAEAESFVCGAGREWWSGSLSAFETGRVH
jgi:hypothetical protein